MFAETEQRSRTFEQKGDRSRPRVGRAVSAACLAAVLAAGMLASASPASADIAVSHSAKGGELRGGRLILRGVSGRVSWWHVTDANTSGTESVRRMHRRLFLPGTPPTGRLHIAGSRDGDEPTFRLSKPRYNASRRTVSYKAKPLRSKPLSRAAAHAAALRAPRRFGAASLSIVPHPTVASGDNGGNDCQVEVDNPLGGGGYGDLDLQSSSKWDTDDWDPTQTPPAVIQSGSDEHYESMGGLWRGCHNETVWVNTPFTGPATIITIDVTWPWTQLPTSTCTVSNPQAYQCIRSDRDGIIRWRVLAI
jgi:hypothetical protein